MRPLIICGAGGGQWGRLCWGASYLVDAECRACSSDSGFFFFFFFSSSFFVAKLIEMNKAKAGEKS